MKEKDHHFLRVYEDVKMKQVVSYVHAEVYDNLYFETMFNVMGLAVLETHQQQGIRKQLMDEVELEAKRRNYLAIRLNSGENRSNAHQFYEKWDTKRISCKNVLSNFVNYIVRKLRR